MNKRWMQEHTSDYYVKQAQKEGYSSRAAYKLLEINKKYNLLQPGMLVLDLGAAPGGWSQVVSGKVGPKGQVIAIDRLPMGSIPGVTFIQGDFNSPDVLEQLLTVLQNEQVDLVISDMAPNITGNKSVDQPRSLQLVELAWDCAQRVLKPGGTLLMKVFQGGGVDALIAELRRHFEKLRICKPKASRARSSEIYVLASGFLGVELSE